MADARTVGANGDNVREDVEAVQEILARWLTESALPTLDVTGVVDVQTNVAIGAFQTAHGVFPDGLLHVVVEQPISLAQGQGDGDTIGEACKAARDDCKARAACAGDQLKMGKCSCWKGGTLNWTCIVQGTCSDPVA